MKKASSPPICWLPCGIFFQGAYLKQQAAIHVKRYWKWEEHVDNNAHYHRRTYNQCGAYKSISFY